MNDNNSLFFCDPAVPPRLFSSLHISTIPILPGLCAGNRMISIAPEECRHGGKFAPLTGFQALSRVWPSKDYLKNRFSVLICVFCAGKSFKSCSFLEK